MQKLSVSSWGYIFQSVYKQISSQCCVANLSIYPNRCLVCVLVEILFFFKECPPSLKKNYICQICRLTLADIPPLFIICTLFVVPILYTINIVWYSDSCIIYYLLVLWVCFKINISSFAARHKQCRVLKYSHPGCKKTCSC